MIFFRLELIQLFEMIFLFSNIYVKNFMICYYMINIIIYHIFYIFIIYLFQYRTIIIRNDLSHLEKYLSKIYDHM